MFTKEASVAFKALSGVVCIYKPNGITMQKIKSTVLGNICTELNELQLSPPDGIVKIIGATNEPMSLKVEPNLAQHPLVTGPQYQYVDINFNYNPYFNTHTSGVCLLGINEGARFVSRLRHARITKAYKIHGVLGSATETNYANGKVIERAQYKHINRSTIDRVVSYIQTMHQRKMFELLGVDIQSQTAYKLAVQGPIRPTDEKIPVLYGIKCVNFEPPNFVIEVQCVNEYENYLYTLIHDIGVQLKSLAHCTSVQCIRYGKFTLDHALLKKHWRLQFILDSISNNRKILYASKKILLQPSAALQ
ncbi:pseudouridylate synthase TRUB2, mitochondrial [Arctopsyche grandis]|uniref:pseudouridylate synthase TRUB2, mitochondrial n=1 Tax=Arctopsyche grandis TaxID=121162 RepID=UPI00406D9592